MIATGLVVALIIYFKLIRRRRETAALTQHGSATLATDSDIARAGMFRPGGLLLGRSLVSNLLIWLHDYIHLSLFATTGGGKVVFPKKNGVEVTGVSGCGSARTRPGTRTPVTSAGGPGCRTLPGTR